MEVTPGEISWTPSNPSWSRDRAISAARRWAASRLAWRTDLSLTDEVLLLRFCSLERFGLVTPPPSADALFRSAIEVERPQNPADGPRGVLIAFPLCFTGEFDRLQSETSESWSLEELVLVFSFDGFRSFEVLPLFFRRLALLLCWSLDEAELILGRAFGAWIPLPLLCWTLEVLALVLIPVLGGDLVGLGIRVGLRFFTSADLAVDVGVCPDCFWDWSFRLLGRFSDLDLKPGAVFGRDWAAELAGFCTELGRFIMVLVLLTPVFEVPVLDLGVVPLKPFWSWTAGLFDGVAVLGLRWTVLLRLSLWTVLAFLWAELWILVWLAEEAVLDLLEVAGELWDRGCITVVWARSVLLLLKWKVLFLVEDEGLMKGSPWAKFHEIWY